MAVYYCTCCRKLVPAHQAGKRGYLYCVNCNCLLSRKHPLQSYDHPTTTVYQYEGPVHQEMQPPTGPMSPQFGPQAPMIFGSDSVTMARPPPPGFPNMPYPNVRYPPNYSPPTPQQAQGFVDQYAHAQDHMDLNLAASGGPPHVSVTNDVQPPQHSPVLPEGHAAEFPHGSSSMETDPAVRNTKEIGGQTIVVIDTPPGTPSGEGVAESKMEVSPEEVLAVSPQESKDKLQYTRNEPDPHATDQESGKASSDLTEANQTSPHVPDETSCFTPDQASPLSPDQGIPSPILLEQASSSALTVCYK